MDRRIAPALAVLLSLFGVAQGAAQTAKKIKHVFIIVLENEGYDTTFGPASKNCVSSFCWRLAPTRTFR